MRAQVEAYTGCALKVGESREAKAILARRGWEMVGAVPIATGCLGERAYCITQIARGRLGNTPMESIVRTDEHRQIVVPGNLMPGGRDGVRVTSATATHQKGIVEGPV